LAQRVARRLDRAEHEICRIDAAVLQVLPQAAEVRRCRDIDSRVVLDRVLQIATGIARIAQVVGGISIVGASDGGYLLKSQP
jgi:hypothetical protein